MVIGQACNACSGQLGATDWFCPDKDISVKRTSQRVQTVRNCNAALWRDGSRHFPLIGKIQHERTYTHAMQKPYDVKSIDYDLRTGSGRTNQLTDRIDFLLRRSPPLDWTGFNSLLHQAAQEVYPHQLRRNTPVSADERWQDVYALHNPPCALVAMSAVPQPEAARNLCSMEELGTSQTTSKELQTAQEAAKRSPT